MGSKGYPNYSEHDWKFISHEENKISVSKWNNCAMSSEFTFSREVLQTPKEMLHDGKVWSRVLAIEEQRDIGSCHLNWQIWKENMHGKYEGVHWFYLDMQAEEWIVLAKARPRGMVPQVQSFHTIKEVQKMQDWLQKQQHFFSYLSSYWKKVERFTCTVPGN